MKILSNASAGRRILGFSMSMGSSALGLGNGRKPRAVGAALCATRAAAEALACPHLLQRSSE